MEEELKTIGSLVNQSTPLDMGINRKPQDDKSCFFNLQILETRPRLPPWLCHA